MIKKILTIYFRAKFGASINYCKINTIYQVKLKIRPSCCTIQTCPVVSGHFKSGNRSQRAFSVLEVWKDVERWIAEVSHRVEGDLLLDGEDQLADSHVALHVVADRKINLETI
jgi:hypothetical protein